MEHTQHPRRLRFRLRTLLIGIAFLALLLVNYIQWVRLQEQRAVAEARAAEAMKARAGAEAALYRAYSAAGEYSRMAAQKTAKPAVAPTKAAPEERQP